mgnify:FL=1
MKYKINESLKYKNFIAIPVDEESIDYGTVIFDTFKEASSKAKELAAEKYPGIWNDGR